MDYIIGSRMNYFVYSPPEKKTIYGGVPALLLFGIGLARQRVPRSRLGGLEIFHINAHKRAGPPRRASKSNIRTQTKLVLASIFFNL